MAKFFVYPFASEPTNREAVPDLAQPDGSISYEQGLGPYYSLNMATSTPPALPMPRKKSNQVFYDITNALRQYQTNGAPDYIEPSDNLGSPYSYAVYARVRYDDGSGVKVYENQLGGNLSSPNNPSWQVISGDPIPSGSIVAYAGATAPTSLGFLVCDGTAVSRVTYPRLFAAIGIAWGPGDGSTTFNLPDLRRRALVGVGGTNPFGILGTTLGSVGGTDSVTLTINQMARHTHSYMAGFYRPPFPNVTSHAHAGEFDLTPGGDGRQTGPTGGGAAHPNIQQSAVAYWIIKT